MIGATHTLSLLAALCLAACAPSADGVSDDSSGAQTGSTSGPGVETKPWDVETETSPQLMTSDSGASGDSTPGTTGMTESGLEDDGKEDGEDDEKKEVFVGLFGWGPMVAGESYNPEGEAVVFLAGEDECIALWTATGIPDATCTECTFAFRLTIETVQFEEDISCTDHGFSADALLGRELAIGLSEKDVLFLDEGAGWAEADGSGEFDRDRGFFEWMLPSEPR